MSTRPVVFNLVNCIIGVSVLAMPFCLQECGIILGTVAMFISSLLTKKSCSLLLKAGQVARKRSYEGLASSAYGAPGKLIVEVSIIGLLIGTLIAFNVIIGDLVPSIFHNLTGTEISWTVRAVLMTILAFGVGLPLSMMRNLHSLSSFSALSLIFYAGFVCQIVFSALPSIMEGSWIHNLNYWRPEKLLRYLSIFSLAFACQPQLFALYETLPEPSIKKMEGVVSTGINIVGCVYFSVGLFGYVCFYNAGVKGDILTNYGNTFVSQIIKLGFVMSVIVSFPLMVYPLRASLNSLIFEQTSNSDNLPGGNSFIPQGRFTYLTLTIISGTLILGILFPQIEFVLALTGATTGCLMAFIYPSTMFLHLVSEKTTARLVAKIVLALGLFCFVAGTYTVLMSEESGSHHEVDIHPPGFDPIKPVDFHNIPQKANDTVVGVNVAPVDLAKIGQGGVDAGKADDKSIVDNLKPAEAKPLDVKPIDGVGNEALKKPDEPGNPVEGGEVRRQEPPVPHAPQDNVPQNAADDTGEVHMKEKRQLMSRGDEEKPVAPVLKESNIVSPNDASVNQVKVSEQEIDAELKTLEESDKVPIDADAVVAADAAKQTLVNKPAEVESQSNKNEPAKEDQDINLLKRDLHQSQDLANRESRPAEHKDTNNDAADKKSDSIVADKKENQTKLPEIDNVNQVGEQLPHNREGLNVAEKPLHQTVLGVTNKTVQEEETLKAETSVKIRDLKSNSKLRSRSPVSQHSSVNLSRSFKALLSKRSPKTSRRHSSKHKVGVR